MTTLQNQHWSREYHWREWRVTKEAGWYCGTHGHNEFRVPFKFKRLEDAKKYCETLDTLLERLPIPDFWWNLDDDKGVFARAYTLAGFGSPVRLAD